MLNTSLPRLSTGSVGGLSSPTVNLNRTRLRLENLVFYGANACSDRKVMQLAGLCWNFLPNPPIVGNLRTADINETDTDTATRTR